MICAAGVLQIGAAELLDQELDALEAIAAMGKAGMRQEADHRLVDLHTLRRLRTVGGNSALGALGGDRAGAVGDDEAHERLEREQLLGRRCLAQQCQIGDLRGRPFVDKLFARHPAEAAAVCFEQLAEAETIVAKRRAYHGKLRAVLRVIFFFMSAPQQIAVVIAARSASAVGSPGSERR